jgi:bifunctional oligoribonuclease and PAP phosphatase NrnA
MVLPAEALDRAVGLLRDAERAVLVCHVNPDADAMGSMLGLGVFLAGRGTEVSATVPNGLGDLPRWVESLPGRELLVAPRDLPKEPPVVVTLDAADRGRLDGLDHLVERAGTSVCIDHHRTNPGFATINLIDPDASATAEIVYRLLGRIGGQIGPDVAACLYAGLVTDTGRFQFESATPEVLRIAADLRERAFDHTRLSQALYEDNSLEFLRLLGTILERATLVPEADLVWTWLTRKDLEGARVAIQETEDLIDVLRTARESDVAAVAKEQRDGGFKVSMRSRGKTNVAAIAERFGGGGHRLAAGYTSKADLDQTGKALVAALTEARAARSGPS